MIDLTIALIITLVLLPLPYLIKVYLRRKRISDAIEPLGGEKWYPFIGTTLGLIRTNRQTFSEVYMARNRQYGPLFRSWMGSIPVIHVMKAEHVEVILGSNTNITKGNNYRFVIPWLGLGLLTNYGPSWRYHRKMITPTFHFKILDNMIQVFTEKAQYLATLLSDKAGCGFFDIAPLLTLCTLDIICESAMGVQINAMSCSDSEYVQAVTGITITTMKRMFNPYMHSDFIFKRTQTGKDLVKYLNIVHGFTRKMIQERKEKLVRGEGASHVQLTDEDILMGGKKRLAFLDLLLEANRKDGNGLTDEQMRAEVDTFMFAGHDTTTSSLLWALFTLGNHPEIQAKVHEELDEIFHGQERPVTPQDVGQMHYLDRVIKESQRLFSAVPVVSRTLDKDIKIDGRTIPAGVMVCVHMYELHRNPEQFPNPEVFDPDRFLPENSANRHPYAFVPFSAGPRNCLGQKFAQRNGKVIMATILRKFKVTAEKKLHEMKFHHEIVLRPQGGLWLSLEERTKNSSL